MIGIRLTRRAGAKGSVQPKNLLRGGVFVEHKMKFLDFEYKGVLDVVDNWSKYYKEQLQNRLKHHLHHCEDKPTVRPASPFNSAEDAEALRNAMKGLGTDEQAIVNILTKRSSSQRQEIIEKYKELYDRDLMKDLKSDVSGVLERVLVSLLKPLPLFLAEQICSATLGEGSLEDTIIEILFTRDDESLDSIKSAFKELAGKTIEEAVGEDTEGAFEKCLLRVLSAKRDDGDFLVGDVVSQLTQEAADLTEDVLWNILLSFSFPFLKTVFKQYHSVTGGSFGDVIAEKCSDVTKKSCTTMYKVIKNKTEYYAEALHEALLVAKRDDSALIRIIVSRCEIDLGTIKEKYFATYKKNIMEDIMAETSGDYEAALIGLVEDLK